MTSPTSQKTERDIDSTQEAHRLNGDRADGSLSADARQAAPRKQDKVIGRQEMPERRRQKQKLIGGHVLLGVCGCSLVAQSAQKLNEDPTQAPR